MDEDCLRRLAGELEAAARHELPWHDANERDLGAILADLLASLADALADHQALVSSEAYLRTQADPGLLRLAVTIDGSLWRRVAGLESAGPSDPVYVAERGAEGSLTLRFDDGQHGRRPPPRRASPSPIARAPVARATVQPMRAAHRKLASAGSRHRPPGSPLTNDAHDLAHGADDASAVRRAEITIKMTPESGVERPASLLTDHPRA